MGKNSLIKTALLTAIFSGQLFASTTIVLLEDRGGIEIKNLIHEPGEIDEDKARYPDEEPLHTKEDGVGGIFANSLYPVVTETMKIGPISDTALQNIRTDLLTNPTFIVGYDRVSVRWLKENLHHLVEKRAIGLVVNVQTPEQMKKLIEITESKIVLRPTPGDGLAKSLNLYNYPAYIDASGVLR